MNLLRKPLSYFYLLIFILSFVNTSVYLSMRQIWFFISKTVPGNLPWAAVFFILFCASSIYSLVLFVRFTKRGDGSIKRPGMISIVLPIILTVLFSGIDIYLYKSLGSSQNIVLRNIFANLPVFIITAAVIFFIIIYPALNISRSNLFRYSAASLLVLLIILYTVDFGKVKITSGPCIKMVDDSSMAVIWTTNKKSTGFVDYGENESSLTRVYASKDGVIEANTLVHKVVVPAGKSESIYRVGSTKINGYFPNNVEYGNTAISTLRKYAGYNTKDKLSFYILNDVHENTKIYQVFLQNKDYDFLVLNGDAVNSVDTDDVIINKIIKPVSQFTGGVKPFYFVRGNHETRGSALRDLPSYLALPDNKYYYTFNLGPVFGVVLDSGEDKADSHEEYSGLADFERYRQEETRWLESVSKSQDYKNAKYRIAFLHIPLNSYENKTGSYLNDYEDKWSSLLNAMNIDAVFSGHTHVPRTIKPDGIKYNFPTFIGGGEYGREKEYIAIKVEITEKGIKVYSIGYDGTIVNETEIRK